MGFSQSKHGLGVRPQLNISRAAAQRAGYGLFGQHFKRENLPIDSNRRKIPYGTHRGLEIEGQEV